MREKLLDPVTGLGTRHYDYGHRSGSNHDHCRDCRE